MDKLSIDVTATTINESFPHQQYIDDGKMYIGLKNTDTPGVFHSILVIGYDGDQLVAYNPGTGNKERFNKSDIFGAYIINGKK